MACPPPNGVVLSFDEKGKTAVKHYGGRKYVFNGYAHTPYGQKVRGVCDLFAARNMHNGQVVYGFYGWKNSYVVCDFLQRLLEEYEGKDVYVIWDGWSAHTSNHTQAFTDIQHRLHVLPLPKRTSWLNPIERDFSQIQSFVLNNSNFQSVRETIAAISDYIEKELSSN